MYYVIGSGPCGVACAIALRRHGRPVTILDAGIRRECDSGSATAFKRVAQEHEERLDAAARSGRNILPRKLAYGSDFPYRPAVGATEIRMSNPVGIEASYALGGLSNVWGSAVLPYRQEDLRDWPITALDLASGYAEVSKIVRIAARHDDLATLFPLPEQKLVAMQQSSQTKKFLGVLQRNTGRLNASGIYFGNSRLAVDASETGCTYCGQCLNGCPLELIYNSTKSLNKLLAQQEVAYINGLTVQSITEQGEKVRISAVERDGSLRFFEGQRAFLAAGPLSSTAILLRSLGLYDEMCYLSDSQYFLFPLLQFSGPQAVHKEPMHTLCQAFLEIIDPKVCDNSIHLQIYSYSSQLADALDKKLGFFGRFVPKNPILNRFLVVQGYLHSSVSPKIGAVLRRDGSSEFLSVSSVHNPATEVVIKKTLRKLLKLARFIGAVPVTPFLQVADAGRGFHSGGSFPMRHSPSKGETDIWGRVYGLKRLHVVDTTILPSIPATTITFTAMANAYRIGAEVARWQNEEVA